jgi:dihydroorotase
MKFDLLFRGGHVIDPSQDLDGVMDVAISQGKIAAIGNDLSAADCASVVDARGSYLSPGLVDLHGHWYEGNLYGIDPRICLDHGVTTAVDAGSTGYANFPTFRKNTIDTTPVNVLAFVHISFMGLLAPFAEELVNLAYARPVETALVIEANRDRALGVKIRIGSMTGDHGLQALEQALLAASEARVPLMVHVSQGAEELKILNRMRAGDILTHCFHGRGNRLYDEGGQMTTRFVCEAADRGVKFDVGHGCGSFSWQTAQRAYEHNFYPDTLSSDLHRWAVGEPFRVTLPGVMSKFLCLGMSLRDVITKTTIAPAKILGKDQEIGTLRPGSRADVLQFDLQEGEFQFLDTHFEKRTGSRCIVPKRVVKDGVMHLPGSVPIRLREMFESDLDVFRAMGWNPSGNKA